jgi:ParB-like chromosome segregation protein Spo0J
MRKALLLEFNLSIRAKKKSKVPRALLIFSSQCFFQNFPLPFFNRSRMAKTIAFQTTKTISSGIGKELQRYGMRLSDIHYVAPSELRANPINNRLFKEESKGYFERLTNDIKEKGILNPLLATSNGKLLAGHNRLRIAEELDLPSVPVQYVEETLSEEREKEIIIKDNLLRRQFSSAEWIQLYQQLYPNFEEEIHKEHRGGDRKSTKNIKGNIKGATGTFDTDEALRSDEQISSALTAKRIASETGQTENAVKKHLRAYKQKGKTSSNTVQKSSHKSPRTEKIDSEMLSALRTNIKDVLRSNETTRKKAVDVLRASLKSLEESL